MSNAVVMEDERLVVFKLAGEDYAVPIAGVHTVERMMPITRVPRAPYFIDGVINLRRSRSRYQFASSFGFTCFGA